MAMRLQLVAGVEVLEEWADSATQAERNVLYEALFAIGDGSVFLIYDVFGDPEDISNFIILVKADLMVKIRVQRAESAFEILYVGTLDDDASAAIPEIAAEVEVDIDEA
ncbi:DUF6235 family protein [Amycolatopsis rifamycinica]|uniref:Uncharacterized protein n=1 Tax=Amycolatopsis rifamycinica TaxID=287986 RepID=A0A066TVI7_9PSEU|nr:DUF6235 family protein [Amycolatopsis rifamycinica]KDN18880.1 hypothetical protein DV20_28450 [Amycolatopsis rifamycinica]